MRIDWSLEAKARSLIEKNMHLEKELYNESVINSELLAENEKLKKENEKLFLIAFPDVVSKTEDLIQAIARAKEEVE